MEALVSIIIPVYNVEKYLRRSLDAVRAQTYQNLEVILIDDGATDKSGKICDEYAAQDERFRVIHKKNGGTGSARNAGLSAATGDFVGFLDADDWPEPDMYENLIGAFLEKEDAAVAQCMSRDFLADGTMVKGPHRDSGRTRFLPVQDYFCELLLHTGDSSFCTKLFRREFIAPFCFEENRLNEDFELLLRMIPKLSGVLEVEKPGYNIELSDNSNTRGRFKAPLYEAMMENAGKAYALAKEHFPKLLPQAKRFVLVQSLDYLLHVPTSQMRRDNAFYQREKKRIKAGRREIRTNPYLDEKQRRNLKLLSTFPMKTLRQVHGFMMRKRIKGGSHGSN